MGTRQRLAPSLVLFCILCACVFGILLTNVSLAHAADAEWRVLLLIFRNTDTDYVAADGSTRHMHATIGDDDIAGLLSAMSGSISRDVALWSGGHATWSIDTRYPTAPLSVLTPLDARNRWPGPDSIRPVLNQYAPRGAYDQVMVYWASKDALGNSIPSWGAWGLALPVNSDGFGYQTVTSMGFNCWDAEWSQVWIHEWLHSACDYYGALGYAMPDRNADGAALHGYSPGQSQYLGWGAYYADLMSGNVLEGGVRKGISPSAWRELTPRKRAVTTHTLTYTAGSGGTISGTSPQTVNHGGSGTPVTAVPGSGYRFVRWSDGSTANPRTDTGVTSIVIVTADFAVTTHTLTYTAGSGGTISGTSPQTVNHGGSGTPVTAVPGSGYRFVRWSDGTTAETRVDASTTADGAVTAEFQKVIDVASVSRAPSGATANYVRRNGVARFTLSAVCKGWGARPIADHYIYLQTSTNGRSWANTYKLRTDSRGSAIKRFAVNSRRVRYYRWYVPAISEVNLKTYSSATKVTVR